MSRKFKVFSVYGIEAEYIIVNRDTLKVAPIADKILQELNGGEICNDVEIGDVCWSNELVNHVLEIKFKKPESDIEDLDKLFHESILSIEELLQKYNCTLMPTAMNPWFDPKTETVLWPQELREIYHLYNEIFDCRGHGWSNLQSVHINFPYQSESEFVFLHSAIRIVLPLIPFLAASSPFYDGGKGTFADNRLAFYEKNQIKIPSIIGNIIPENVGSFEEYHSILRKIYADISKYDHAKTLQNPWLNSRAAIPKFDVGAIEIRLMDIQESPYMDFAIAQLIIELVKFVYSLEDAKKNGGVFTDQYLREVYEASKQYNPEINLTGYFDLFGIAEDKGKFSELRAGLVDKFMDRIPQRYHRGLKILKEQGSLSERLIKEDLSLDLYKKIIDCLVKNEAYEN
ncbi:MAG: glutamate--cysteine ligase [Halobacteriovoraceae bacterium]|nr:glutamate--cysteine ligase [Halobacteriovoraceae bacterium]